MSYGRLAAPNNEVKTAGGGTRAGAPGNGGGLADGIEVSLALRTVRAAERANELSVQQLRMQYEASQRAIKTEKEGSDKHDTHDMKILRMLVNDFSATYTPPVAESKLPSADTRMLTSQWLPTVRRRVADAATRAELYGILFVPTSRILKSSAKVRFGRKGLHPDLFKTCTFENVGTMAPLDADVDALDKPLSSGDLSGTLVVLDERCEQMVNWVSKVLSRNMAVRLREFFEWGSRQVKHDRKGLWTLADWKGLILDVLDDVTRHIDVQLDACKSLCEEGVDDDAFFPSLSRVRLVALTKRPDGTRSIKPAWECLWFWPTSSTRRASSRSPPRWCRCGRSSWRPRSTSATELERWRAHLSRSGRWGDRSAPRRRPTGPRRKFEPAGVRQTLTRRTPTRLAEAPTATPAVPS